MWGCYQPKYSPSHCPGAIQRGWYALAARLRMPLGASVAIWYLALANFAHFSFCLSMYHKSDLLLKATKPNNPSHQGIISSVLIADSIIPKHNPLRVPLLPHSHYQCTRPPLSRYGTLPIPSRAEPSSGHYLSAF